ALEAQRLAQGARRVCLRLTAAPREEALGERCQVTGKELGVRAVFLGEGTGLPSPLEIEYAELWVGADRRAQYRLDPSAAHAGPIAEARIEQGGGGHDRLPRRERLCDDPAGDRRSHRLDLVCREAMGHPPRLAPHTVVVVLD